MTEEELYLKYLENIKNIVNEYDQTFEKLNNIEAKIQELRQEYDKLLNDYNAIQQKESDLLSQIKQEKKQQVSTQINNNEEEQIDLHKILTTILGSKITHAK